MKERVVIIAPGRGTYGKGELGYLGRHHADKAALLAEADAYRSARGQPALTVLDGSARFSGAEHTRGDNAAALIHACAYLDFLSIDRDRYDIVGITGNSMGWYIALTCAGALKPMDGLHLVNTMGTLMQEHLIGGQILYPFVDDTWRAIPGKRQEIEACMARIDARPGHRLALSIDLGGMLVLAGNAKGIDAFEAEMPPVQGRFPMRLQNHAAFHTELQAPVARAGQAALAQSMFRQPALPLIDGRGGFWWPKASDLAGLYAYTLGHQVVRPYDFTAAIRSAARELMPDRFILLGPGTTLGGATAQALIGCRWRGWQSKRDLARDPRILSMGRDDQRGSVTQ